VPHCVPSTVRINSDRRRKRRERRAGGCRLWAGASPDDPPAGPPAEGQMAPRRGARPARGRPWIGPRDESIPRFVDQRSVALWAAGHDLSRRQWLANSHSDSVCQNSLQSLGAASFFWGALCLPYVVAEADHGSRLWRRVDGPASTLVAPVLRAPPPVGALRASQPRTVDLETRLLCQQDLWSTS